MHKFLAPALSLVALLAAAGTYFLHYSLNKTVDQLVITKDVSQETQVAPPYQAIDGCGEVCKNEIDKKVAEAIATISALPKIAPKTSASNTKTQTVYVPLDGPVSTTSTAWVDVPGVEVSIDRVNDYGSGAKVSWEASLKVAYGNGQAFARLLDVTHGTSVDGSEISTTSNAVATNISSGNITLWSGRNLYRLQLKSLTGYEVTFSSGRIKITY